MFHWDYITVSLTRDGNMYSEHNVEDRSQAVPDEFTGQISQVMVLPQIGRLGQAEEVTVVVDLGKDFKWYSADAVQVRVCAGNPESTLQGQVMIDKKSWHWDLASREKYWRKSFEVSLPLPRSKSTASNLEWAKLQEANAGSIAIFITRGYKMGCYFENCRNPNCEGDFFFDPLLRGNGKPYCFEFRVGSDGELIAVPKKNGIPNDASVPGLDVETGSSVDHGKSSGGNIDNEEQLPRISTHHQTTLEEVEPVSASTANNERSSTSEDQALDMNVKEMGNRANEQDDIESGQKVRDTESMALETPSRSNLSRANTIQPSTTRCHSIQNTRLGNTSASFSKAKIIATPRSELSSERFGTLPTDLRASATTELVGPVNRKRKSTNQRVTHVDLTEDSGSETNPIKQEGVSTQSKQEASKATAIAVIIDDEEDEADLLDRLEEIKLNRKLRALKKRKTMGLKIEG